MKKNRALILLFFFGCNTLKVEYPTNDFFTIMDDKSCITGKLKINGFYNSITNDTTMYYASSPLFFFENKKIFSDVGMCKDSLTYLSVLQSIFENPTKLNQWGYYTIKRDTLLASFYEGYYNKNVQRMICVCSNYRGIISSIDTIKDWKLVPPYPKVEKKFNESIIETRKKGITLIFKPFDYKNKINSNNTWIDKIKK